MKADTRYDLGGNAPGVGIAVAELKKILHGDVDRNNHAQAGATHTSVWVRSPATYFETAFISDDGPQDEGYDQAMMLSSVES